MNQMPPVTKNLLIINCLCFAAGLVGERYGIDLNDMLGLHFFMAEHFMPYQLVTYLFMHGGWEHLFFNMFALWMFGRIIEHVMGCKRFLIYYLLCGIGAGLVQELVQYVHYISMDHVSKAMHFGQLIEGNFVVQDGMAVSINLWNTVGASGAVYGILLAFGLLFPEERMFIFPLPVPIKAKYFVIGYALIELFAARSNDGVAHYAHLGGMLAGLILLIIWTDLGDNDLLNRLRRPFGRKGRKRDNINVYRRNY